MYIISITGEQCFGSGFAFDLLSMGSWIWIRTVLRMWIKEEENQSKKEKVVDRQKSFRISPKI
jgi:hypothetical protein